MSATCWVLSKLRLLFRDVLKTHDAQSSHTGCSKITDGRGSKRLLPQPCSKTLFRHLLKVAERTNARACQSRRAKPIINLPKPQSDRELKVTETCISLQKEDGKAGHSILEVSKSERNLKAWGRSLSRSVSDCKRFEPILGIFFTQ